MSSQSHDYFLSLRFNNKNRKRTEMHFSTLSEMAQFITKDSTKSHVISCHTCHLSRKEASILSTKLYTMCNNNNFTYFQLALKIRLKFNVGNS